MIPISNALAEFIVDTAEFDDADLRGMLSLLNDNLTNPSTATESIRRLHRLVGLMILIRAELAELYPNDAFLRKIT
jgi:hypothetical protein